METLKNVDHANVNNNDISTVGGDYNRSTSTTFNIYRSGNSEPFIPKLLDQTPIDWGRKHNYVKSSIRAHPAAGDWLLRSKTYKLWKSGKLSTRLLWLNGIPGVGKTVICSRVIDDLRNEQDHRVVFFYCHDMPTRCDSRSILASLLRQLLNYTPSDYSKSILKNYNETKLEDVQDLMLTELVRKISFSYGKTFIVIDALNECSNLEDMLQEFVILAEELCIFISSRDHSAIRMKFERYEQIRIREDDTVEDIRQYVTKEVTRINRGDNILRKSVTDKLIKGAQGSFLWPVCQVQRLRGAKTDTEMEDILTTIPQGMQSAIVKSLKAIDSEKNSKLLRSALQLVVRMPRPITVQALSEVMDAIEMKATDTWNPDPITRNPQGLDFAGLLICVSGKERNRYEPCWSKGFSFDHFGDDDIVVPFHLCVKEYLLADPVMLPSHLKKYSLHPLKANDDSITKICSAYRNLVLKHVWEFQVGLDRAHYPFAEYAREWLSHTTLTSGDDIQKHGIVVSKKTIAIVIVLILMSYIFALIRPCEEPSFPSLDHAQRISEWKKVVSCGVVSEHPRWFGLFGKLTPVVQCTSSSVMDPQTETNFIKLFQNSVPQDVVRTTTERAYWMEDNRSGKLGTEVTTTEAAQEMFGYWVEHNSLGEETASKLGTEVTTTEAAQEVFEYWVEHNSLGEEIASKLGTENTNIGIETAKELLTSIEPPSPPSDTVKGYNPWLDKPRPTTIEEYLRNFEVIFVVDDSGSMKGGRWMETRDALATIAQKTFELKVDTVSLRFLNDANYVRGLKGKNILMSLFDMVRPRGWTPLGRALKAVFKEHLNRIDTAVGKGEEEYSKILPLDIIVLTDGVPTDKGEDELREVIAKAVKRLNDNHYHPNTMSVQIIQIANKETAKKVFRDLVVGDNGRIVDTVPYAGIMDSEKLLKILLGGVHPNIRSQLPVVMLVLEQPELEKMD